MIDEQIVSDLEWIQGRLKEIETALKPQDQAASDYLQWMAENGYAKPTIENYEKELQRFKVFVKKKRRTIENSFTHDVLRQFLRLNPICQGRAIRGLSIYLYEQGIISRSLRMKQVKDLPQTYEDYLVYQKKHHQASYRRLMQIRTVLAALHQHLKKHQIRLQTVTIEKLDAFLAEYLAPYKPQTCATYRSCLRGFLRYLHFERNLLSVNLAPLLVSAPQFSKNKPANFLRPDELHRLFAGLKLSSPSELRTYAMVHLAYTLGMRPCEISWLNLKDVFFEAGELNIRSRKNVAPVKLPVPEETIKAIAAYVVGGRLKSSHRGLFLTLLPPIRPVSQNTVAQAIHGCMKKMGIPYSAYALRHTYAQNLLEAGLSLYEIKEMMGHDSIESTKKYLHVHIKMMREVLFDEAL
jgi:site-specific recombinase XerD